ncbi:hypothetical protein CEV08_04805 [Bartonella tribocorum]|uniref:Uncharacterized protein n=1 Tax=Bartonella tribocorum TaxID=85701 RepID=A0A2M6UVB5_9HYPH|nr:hypothetical protein CEV08_04805 [Bartonella tribocorum]
MQFYFRSIRNFDGVFSDKTFVFVVVCQLIFSANAAGCLRQRSRRGRSFFFCCSSFYMSDGDEYLAYILWRISETNLQSHYGKIWRYKWRNSSSVFSLFNSVFFLYNSSQQDYLKNENDALLQIFVFLVIGSMFFM